MIEILLKCAFHSIVLNQPSVHSTSWKSSLKMDETKSWHRANKYMLKDHNRNTRTRWGINSKLTIKTQGRRRWPRYDAFIVNFTSYFTCYCRVRVCIVDFEQENACEEPVLWISIYPRAEQRHRSTVFIFNFEHFSHLVLVLLLLILSMYLIAGFDISYFSRF